MTQVKGIIAAARLTAQGFPNNMTSSDLKSFTFRISSTISIHSWKITFNGFRVRSGLVIP